MSGAGARHLPLLLRRLDLGTGARTVVVLGYLELLLWLYSFYGLVAEFDSLFRC